MIARPAQFSAKEVQLAVQGRLLGPDVQLNGVSTDTRDDLNGRLYIALSGQRFDGAQFMSKAIESGAAGVLVSEEGWRRHGSEALAKATPIVITEDTYIGLGVLARHHRRKFSIPLIAVTGSNGKTTTKDMMAAALGGVYEVLSTAGNLNNLVGLPLTLLGIQPQHNCVVCEMGMNRLQEIATMVRYAEPSMGVVTNIGPAHIGELGSQQAVADAKGEMYSTLPQEALRVANLDDPLVMEQLKKHSFEGMSVVTFGRNPDADVCLLKESTSASGQDLLFKIDDFHLEVSLKLIGGHNALNAACALAVAVSLGDKQVMAQAAKRGLDTLEPTKGRLHVRAIGPYWVVDDSYNANASSAIAAVQTVAELAKSKGSRWFLAFGEMQELGDFSIEAHQSVGEACVQNGAAGVATLGNDTAPLVQVVSSGGLDAVLEPSQLDALCGWLKQRLQPGDYLLIKGSRSARMERLIDQLADEA